MLGRCGRFDVVAEYRNAASSPHHAAVHRPEIVIVGLSLPDVGETELLPRLRAAVPAAKLVVLTMHDRPDDVLESVRAGIDGHRTNRTDPRILAEALKLVAQNQMFFDRPTMRHIPDMAARNALVHGEASAESYGLLTQREQEVLRMPAEGLSTKQVGSELGIGHRTAENRRPSVMKKLGLRSMVKVVRRAQRIGGVE